MAIILYISSGLYNVSIVLLPSKASASFPKLEPQRGLWPTSTRQWGRSSTVLAPSLGLSDCYAFAVPLRALLPQWGWLQVNILRNGELMKQMMASQTWPWHRREPRKRHQAACTWQQMRVWAPLSIQPGLHQNHAANLQTMIIYAWPCIPVRLGVVYMQEKLSDRLKKVICTRHSCAWWAPHTWNPFGR